MNVWNGKAMSFMGTVTNMIILNILWVITSIPLITIGPSTAAMLSVIRKWHLNKETSVVRLYVTEFKRFLKPGVMIGTTWFVVGFILLVDLYVLLHITSHFKFILLTLLITAMLLYVMTSSFLFHILVHYETKGLLLIKQAFTYSFLDGKTTLAICLLCIGVGVTLFFLPFAILIIIVPMSMISHRFALHSFERIELLPKVKLKYVSES